MSNLSENKKDEYVGSVVMGGSVRGLFLMFMKKSYWKAVFRKQAFLKIGKQVRSNEKELIASSLPRHSKLLVTTEAILMGVAVFGTYDFVLHRWNEQHQETESSQRSVLVDLGAGAAAGVVQSMFWISWETLVNKSQLLRDYSHFCMRVTAHNAVGFGGLFGSYQGIRQVLLASGPFENLEDSLSNKLVEIPSGLVSTFLAGGLAGQFHHVLTHYTSHWKSSNRRKLPPVPRLRHTLSSFLPMALCFSAFEHGVEACDHLFRIGEDTTGLRLDQFSDS